MDTCIPASDLPDITSLRVAIKVCSSSYITVHCAMIRQFCLSISIGIRKRCLFQVHSISLHTMTVTS